MTDEVFSSQVSKENQQKQNTPKPLHCRQIIPPKIFLALLRLKWCWTESLIVQNWTFSANRVKKQLNNETWKEKWKQHVIKIVLQSSCLEPS